LKNEDGSPYALASAGTDLPPIKALTVEEKIRLKLGEAGSTPVSKFDRHRIVNNETSASYSFWDAVLFEPVGNIIAQVGSDLFGAFTTDDGTVVNPLNGNFLTMKDKQEAGMDMVLSAGTMGMGLGLKGSVNLIEEGASHLRRYYDETDGATRYFDEFVDLPRDGVLDLGFNVNSATLPDGTFVEGKIHETLFHGTDDVTGFVPGNL